MTTDFASEASVPLRPDAPAAVEEAGGATPYSFRRPDRVSKEQLRSLHFLHDRFVAEVSTSLSAYLRAASTIGIAGVDQCAYGEFLSSLQAPTAFYALSLAPFEELGALEISPPTAFAIVERMLGGPGQTWVPSRALTEIEQKVIDSVVKLLLDGLSETWRPVAELELTIRGRETRPQMLQVAAPNDIIVRLTFEVIIGAMHGSISLAVPASVVEAAGARAVQAWQAQRRDLTPTERAWLHENLNRVSFTLTTVLETRLAAREILAVKSGDVIGLGIPTERPVEVRVASTPKFTGRLAAEAGQRRVCIEDWTRPGGMGTTR